MTEYKLYLGDCVEIAKTLPKPDAVISDPPYGIKNACNYTRFTGGLSPSRNHHKGIANDDRPFDPTPWLDYPKVALFGFQFFAKHLPIGSTLVWNKRRPNQLGKFLSDCEIAWFNKGKGCYLFNHVWNGFDRESERGEKTLHPSQKPVAVFEELLTRLKVKPGETVLDPYCGSGSCGVACLRNGMNFIGIDIEPAYIEIAERRLKEASV